MPVPLSDTRPEAKAVQIRPLRQAPTWRKLQLVARMNRTVQTLALSGLCRRHPAAPPAELYRRLADLLLGPALATQVHGPQEVQTEPMLDELITMNSLQSSCCWWTSWNDWECPT